MPIGRYFLYIGSLLLALLFLANWYFPPLRDEASGSGADRYAIRIHSVQKWPKAVVIDTTLPTIVPPPAIAAAKTPAPEPAPRDAYAMATEPAPAAKPAEAVKPAKRHVRRTRTARDTARPGGPDMYGFRDDWFAPPRPRREASASRNQAFGSRGFWTW
jgi:hypothetical protein